MKRLIFGCGYLGMQVARRWRDDGDQIHVVTRSAQRTEQFAAGGYEAIVADVTRPETLSNLPISDTVLFAVGFDRSAGGSIAGVYAAGVRNVLAELSADLQQFIYISTTGVYGSTGGEWVDELIPPHPARDGGKASLAAEQVLAVHPIGERSIVLRLAGIYGAGRVPYLDKLAKGEPIAAPREGWLNLIHVDDAAMAVTEAATWAQRHPSVGPHLFCVSDGHPVVRANYYREVARLIGAPPPQFVEPDPNSPAALRAGANRRVSNEKMMRELGMTLKYPSFREGLAAILLNHGQSGS